MHKTSRSGMPAGKRFRSLSAVLMVTFSASFAVQAVANQPVRHPLDPLTTREYAAVTAALKRANYVDENSRYALITLEEPPKVNDK